MVKKIVKRNVNERHWGITILAVLAYISAVFTLLGGLVLIFGGSFLSKIIENSLFAIGAGLMIILGIICIAFAVLDYYIARGLWKGQSWSRILVLILFAISALGSLVSFDIVSLAIDVILIWYLGFYKPVINYFK